MNVSLSPYRFWLLGSVTLALALFAGCEAGSLLVIRRDVSNPEAILMLASHEWERLPVTALLAKEFPDAQVLLTQPVRPTQFNCHLCADRPNWLQHLGVEKNRVVVLSQRAANTYQEALAARAYMTRHSMRRLMVVTSPYHSRRALATFHKVLGVRVQVGLRPALERSPARPGVWWRGPYDRAYVGYEWSALGWYALRYGVLP